MPPKPPASAGANVPIWAEYSLAERDRRWKAVRENAAKAGLDCIFVPLGNGTDGRYLTQLRCSAMVLPTDGRPPVIIADRSSHNSWAPDPWQTSREWADPMALALIESGMENARIGVVGLRGGKVSHVRSIDGVVNHTAYTEVVKRLPQAKFEDATDIVGFVRYVKSDEEIECLRRSTEIAEAGIDEMAESARPGADAADVYARVMGRMLELGSEYYPLAVNIGPIGEDAPRQTNPPIGRRLQANDLITNEVSAVWGAQVSQEDQPILLGTVPDLWKPVIELQREVFEAGLNFMKPGISFGELIDFVNGFGGTRGMKTLTLVHGRGYGDDGPLISPRSKGESIRDVRIEKGNAFVWKPYAMSADEKIQFVWGGDVVVTDNGGERLFRRSHGVVSIT
ncbi:MAG: M24 family metallopeptidase [Deltaproteobacteria bacterium]|nr:M24 family metallopeptidase [Deltaproteobacteria bacterium]